MVVANLGGFANSTASSDIDVTNSSLECPVHVEGWGAFYAFLSPVFFTGLLGNGLVIFVFARHKKVRSTPNCLLMSLAVADFITLTLCATAPAYDFVEKHFPLICPVVRLIMETVMLATSFSLVSLSVERYFAISRPLRTKATATSFIQRALTFTWLGAFILSLLKLYFRATDKCRRCFRMTAPQNITLVFAITTFLIEYVIPLLVIAIFYILMARKLYLSGRSLQQNETLIRQLEVRKRLALRVHIFAVLYAISFFPYNFFSIKMYLLEDHSISQDIGPLITILYCIGCTHISLNPIILYLFSKSFRTYFNNYLFFRFFKQSGPL